MTIKTRITRLIVGAGLAAGLVFSVVVFFQLIQQPFRILDRVMREEAYQAVEIVIGHKGHQNPDPYKSCSNPVSSYWIKIHDKNSNELVYRSTLAKAVVLPDVKQHEKRIVYSSVPKEIVLPWQIRGEKIAFRIRTFGVPYDGRQFTVQIARPITKLEEEIREVVLMLVGGLAASCVVLVLLSRLLAAKILKPIGTMKEMTREIGAQNLDKRLPVAPENDEINDLAETINWMLDRLQKSFARQRNFLFDSSHELKTPLTTMRLALGQILESDAGSASEPTRENLLQLQAQVLRMDRLVKDLLNLSALETMTQIDPKPVDLPKILESLADDYQLLADARRIRIDTDVPELAQIQGDGEKLRRAFSNLLDNAIKYNRDGGDVKMTGAESDGEIRISISNTGPGIPDAEIDKVFGQFYRVESSRSSRHGGSGLGLAIVKRTIELHGGNVRIHSDPDGLTTVTVTLPERG